MVYLSQILLDPRRRAAGRALADLYALHQLVYLGFPDGEAGGAGRVLFRLDAGPRESSAGPQEGGAARLLVQSEREPDWHRLADSIIRVQGPKEWHPQVVAGQVLRFRLRASPTKRVPFPRGHPQAGHQRQGLLTRPEQAQWLERQGQRCGFSLCATPPDWFDAFEESEPRMAVQITSLGHLKGEKAPLHSGHAATITHLAVDFDGLLQVTDPTAFIPAVTEGIGPGKAFGLGLLSVAAR